MLRLACCLLVSQSDTQSANPSVRPPSHLIALTEPLKTP